MDTYKSFNKELLMNPYAKRVLFFMCPYKTKTGQFRMILRRFNKAGFIVVAYDFNPGVFRTADLTLLPKLIDAVTLDVQSTISQYKVAEIKEFGFMASSLGGFITYSMLARVPDFDWGVFNTAGNVWLGVWEFPKLRKLYIKQGYQLADLEKAWTAVQSPNFKHNLQGNYYLFLGSTRDKIAPVQRINSDVTDLKQTGATVIIEKRLPVGHGLTVSRGLLAAYKEVKKARRRWKEQASLPLKK